MTLLEVDPNWVKPGWTPLLITIGLAAVIVLLFFSMRRQFRKIDAAGARLPTEQSLRESRVARDVRIDRSPSEGPGSSATGADEPPAGAAPPPD